MKKIKGFEGEDITVSDFGEWVGKDYIDYKFEYKNNKKIIKVLEKQNQKYKEVINKAINYINNNIIGIDIKSDNIMLNRTELLDILKEVEHE